MKLLISTILSVALLPGIAAGQASLHWDRQDVYLGDSWGGYGCRSCGSARPPVSRAEADLFRDYNRYKGQSRFDWYGNSRYPRGPGGRGAKHKH